MLPIAILLAITTLSHGGRILGVIPTSSYSHQSFYHPLWRELASRGHELVVLTTDPIKDPSLTTLKEIDLHGAYEIWNRNIKGVITTNKKSEVNSLFQMVDTVHEVIEWELQHPEVQTLINNQTEHFDLVMIEFLFPTMFAFKHRFNCPFIGLTSLDATKKGHAALGNPTHSLLYPESFLEHEENPTFFKRVVIIAVSIFLEFIGRQYILPIEDGFVEKYFGKEYPKLNDIRNTVDMLFTNVNPVFTYNRPVTPSTISIGGGMHIKKLKPLPEDLKIFLDNATNGFIYFSLGSNVKSKDIPIQTRQILLEVLSELPYHVLWKFEDENLEDKPDNVKIMKWIPQQDVLRHPNIKLFITQGGLQSLEEGLFSRVPLFGIPFLADQFANAKKIVSKGLGLIVDYEKINHDDLKKSLLEVIENPKYRERVNELANIVSDQPMTGLERAVWWTEYVLRNKGAQHLKGPNNLPLYQYYYLDIIAFLSTLIGVFILIIYFIARMLKHTDIFEIKNISRFTYEIKKSFMRSFVIYLLLLYYLIHLF